jgi:Tfp pilus assembly protein PilW
MTDRHEKQRRRTAGVSLLETIVVVGVMSIIMLTITQIFILNYNIYSRQSKRAGNDTGAILTAQAISQLTRGASNVETSHVFNGTTRSSSSSTLVLKMPALDVNGVPIPMTYDYVAIYRDATVTTKIFIDTDADPASFRKDGTRLITDYNATMIFRYNSTDITTADRVAVYLVNTQTDRTSTLTSRAWTSIFLRNAT